MSTINLYTQEGCPKCTILRRACNESEFIKHNDFKEIKLNPADDKDTDLQLLIEHDIRSMPVLLVDDKFYNFGEAMEFLGDKEEGYTECESCGI